MDDGLSTHTAKVLVRRQVGHGAVHAHKVDFALACAPGRDRGGKFEDAREVGHWEVVVARVEDELQLVAGEGRRDEGVRLAGAAHGAVCGPDLAACVVEVQLHAGGRGALGGAHELLVPGRAEEEVDARGGARRAARRGWGATHDAGLSSEGAHRVGRGCLTRVRAVCRERREKRGRRGRRSGDAVGAGAKGGACAVFESTL